jgi:hypothetical protein
MIVGFGRGETGVVTRRAVIHDADMIKRCGKKPRRLVAVGAITVSWYMVVGFSCSGNAVMT